MVSLVANVSRSDTSDRDLFLISTSLSLSTAIGIVYRIFPTQYYYDIHMAQQKEFRVNSTLLALLEGCENCFTFVDPPIIYIVMLSTIESCCSACLIPIGLRVLRFR
uniref:Uncharacterized protein n=1 Tax=Glossina brevipalpis TaxID=37001 RepID=A0A1A9WTE8_9MUSC